MQQIVGGGKSLLHSALRPGYNNCYNYSGCSLISGCSGYIGYGAYFGGQHSRQFTSTSSLSCKAIWKKREKVGRRLHYKYTKLTLGPLVLTKKMERMYKYKSSDTWAELEDSGDSTHHYYSTIKGNFPVEFEDSLEDIPPAAAESKVSQRKKPKKSAELKQICNSVSQKKNDVIGIGGKSSTKKNIKDTPDNVENSLEKTKEKVSKKKVSTVKSDSLSSLDSINPKVESGEKKKSEPKSKGTSSACDKEKKSPKKKPTKRNRDTFWALSAENDVIYYTNNDPVDCGYDGVEEPTPGWRRVGGTDCPDQENPGSEEILKLQLEDSLNVPSVTKILRETMPKERLKILAAWEERMKLQLGEEGFQEYRRKTFERGKTLHTWVENFLAGSQLPHSSQVEDEVSRRHLDSLSPLLPLVSGVRAIESGVVHPHLNYCGIVDCVARIGDSLCVIDWKTSEKAKPDIRSLYDSPLQLAAYIGALNADPRYRCLGEVRRAAVVVVYNTGYPAVVHRLDEAVLDHHWAAWLHRVRLYRERGGC